MPLPPRLHAPGVLALLGFVERVLRGIERFVKQILRADVCTTAIRAAAIDHDHLSVIDVHVVDRDAATDLRRQRAQARITDLDLDIVVDVRVDDLRARRPEQLTERLHVGRVMLDASGVLHHLPLARREGVAHRGLRDVQQDAHGHALACLLRGHGRNLVADRIVKVEKDGDVDRALCAPQIGKERRHDPMAVHEDLGVRFGHGISLGRCGITPRVWRERSPRSVSARLTRAPVR